MTTKVEITSRSKEETKKRLMEQLGMTEEDFQEYLESMPEIVEELKIPLTAAITMLATASDADLATRIWLAHDDTPDVETILGTLINKRNQAFSELDEECNFERILKYATPLLNLIDQAIQFSNDDEIEAFSHDMFDVFLKHYAGKLLGKLMEDPTVVSPDKASRLKELFESEIRKKGGDDDDTPYVKNDDYRDTMYQ